MGKPQARDCLWLSILLASSVCAFALDPSLDVSQYAHTSWKIREGFVKGIIDSMAQTPDGYLWLATQSGLYRFDGVHIVPWQPPPGEKLPSDFVHRLVVGRDGTLWIGTDKGLASLKNDRLTQYPEFAGRRINPLLRDAEGTIWFGLRDPGTLCAIRSTKPQCYGAGSFGASVSALYEDHKGNLWVSATTGLWRWAPGTRVKYTFPGKATQANSLVEDSDLALLMATSKPGPVYGQIKNGFEGLKRLADGKILSFDLPVIGGHFRPVHLFKSSDGSLWIGTVEGLLHLHQGRIDKFSVNDGLSGEIVICFFEDREGNVWVGTSGGLDRFREFAVPTISAKQGISIAPDVLEATPDGSIWVATADGLNRWQNGHVTVYGKRNVPDRNGRTNDRERMIDTRVTEVRNNGLQDATYSLGQDDRGRLWAGTRAGVFYFDGGRFVPVPGITGGDIFSIAGGRQGNVWISSNDSLLEATPDSVQRIPWSQFGGKNPAAALLFDRLQGGLWLGIPDGRLSFLKDGQVRASYSAADGLGRGVVMDLHAGSDGAVWAATEGGLSRVKDGRIETLTSRNGLPCDAVNWVVEDDDHSFWLSMACGLVRIARPELDAWVTNLKRTIQGTVFDGTDGVWSRSLPGRYSRNVAKSPDGKIWFSSPDGVSVVDPHHLAFNKLPPPVHIEQITSDGKKYDVSQGLRLPAHVRDLAIDYTGMSFVVPDKVHFRFKLEGQDKDWREVINRRRAEYSNLPPGNYRFRVTASNNSGLWNQECAVLDFAIAPAYYQTNWFRALCVLTFLAMLWTVYQLRVRALEQRQAVLEQHQALLERHQTEIRALNEQRVEAQEAERMRIAGELHDGVLQQITSLTLRLGMVKRQVPPDSEAKATVSTLQQQLIQIGTDIRHISHELHPALLQDAGLPAALSAYCREFSKVRGLPLSCETDESVKELSPGAALCLYRIAQEALGNAAKYSAAKEVEVRLTQSDGRVCLSVSDDGVGCAPDQMAKSGGLGVINMRERVLQLNGTFEFDSEPGRGTRVRVTVPFREAA